MHPQLAAAATTAATTTTLLAASACTYYHRLCTFRSTHTPTLAHGWGTIGGCLSHNSLNLVPHIYSCWPHPRQHHHNFAAAASTVLQHAFLQVRPECCSQPLHSPLHTLCIASAPRVCCWPLAFSPLALHTTTLAAFARAAQGWLPPLLLWSPHRLPLTTTTHYCCLRVHQLSPPLHIGFASTTPLQHHSQPLRRCSTPHICILAHCTAALHCTSPGATST